MEDKKRTIAVLIPNVDRYYQRDLWQAILHEANSLGYSILFFCGGVLNSPLRDEVENNIIYNLCNLDQVDGIISVSGTLSNYAGIEAFEHFINRFNDKPLINISLELDNSNCITVDNYKSMQRLMTHIFTHHDYQKYVYISGPKTNSESIRRTEAFLEAMAEHAVPSENIMHYVGDFSKESAIAVVNELFDKHQFSPDIVICANDEMAIGVQEALMARNIDMPEQIAFTGFDDIDNATTFVPSFTTIRQPLYELGQESVRGIHQLITGQMESINKALAGTLMVRESCGCFSIPISPNMQKYQGAVAFEASLTKANSPSITEIIKAIKAQYQGPFGKQVDELLELLVAELNQEVATGTFMRKFSKMSYHGVMTGALPIDFKWFINWLRASLKQFDALNLSDALNEIIYNCAMVIGDVLIRQERKENYYFIGMYYYSSELILELTQVTRIDQLFQTLLPYLKAYNFDDFYVCLFDEPMIFNGNDTFVFPDEMNMELGYTKAGVLPSCRFDTKTMLPAHLMEHANKHQHIFYPLFFRKEHFGYIICDIHIATKSIFRTIKEQIANTLERIRVNKKLEAYNLQLQTYNKQLAEMAIKDAMTGLLNRRGIFEIIDIAMEEAKTTGRWIGVVFSDIDGLKIINDAYGHQSGDVAIKAIGKVLLEVFSPYGEVARVGGDEFICILRNHEDDGHLESLFLQVNESLKAYNSKNLHPFKVNVSMGFSKWDPAGDQTINQVLNASDEELYRNKRKFRA